MKKIINKIKQKPFLYAGVCLLTFLFLTFVLYLVNVRFRFWFIVLVCLFIFACFIMGIIKLFNKSSKPIKVFMSLIILMITCIFLMFAKYIIVIFAFVYKPEHTVRLDGKTYVAVVSAFLHVSVDYYDYYGPFLMGTKVRVSGDFGRGGYDPFVNPNISDGVVYTYYDNKEKIKSKRGEDFVKDDDGNIINKNSYDIDTGKFDNNLDASDNYLLPENATILYEKKFDNVILRFSKVDNVLGQNMLVHVVRSKDNGKNFYVISDDVIQVSNEAKFVFLNEKLGFAISTGKIYLNNSKNSLYVTSDSGKTFTSASFKYTNDNVDYISVEEVPYYDNNVLKIKCSVYQINSNKDGYENIELIFVSNDNGLTWNLEGK